MHGHAADFDASELPASKAACQHPVNSAVEGPASRCADTVPGRGTSRRMQRLLAPASCSMGRRGPERRNTARQRRRSDAIACAVSVPGPQAAIRRAGARFGTPILDASQENPERAQSVAPTRHGPVLVGQAEHEHRVAEQNRDALLSARGEGDRRSRTNAAKILRE